MSVIKKVDSNSLAMDVKMYCENCCENLVEARNLSSGSFYQVTGHVWKVPFVIVSKPQIGEYVVALFSICSECEKKDWK